MRTLYEIYARAFLNGLAEERGGPMTLDDLEEADLERFADRGFDAVWMMGVWKTGEAGRRISLSIPELTAGFAQALPDFSDEDVSGSPYAIRGYELAADLGGPGTLQRLRTRLHLHGLRLILDFVPNHVALDHPWAMARPELFVHGTDDDLVREPHNYLHVATQRGLHVLAHGRDPYFPGWTDTLQLDYTNPELVAAMKNELLHIATLCDGVRCDMAMLLLPDVFNQTWRSTAAIPFWQDAIAAVKDRHPKFTFIAEAYWGREAELLELGFDFAYDKQATDLLERDDARGAGAQLFRPEATRSVHFIENHDETRSAVAFPSRKLRPSAIAAALAPGLALFYEGQLEGARAQASIHLRRKQREPISGGVAAFYDLLVPLAQSLTGPSERLDVRAAWAGSTSHEALVVFRNDALLVVLNLSDAQAQGYVNVEGLEGDVVLNDRLSFTIYLRDGAAMGTQGLYLDLPGRGFHAFEIRRQ